MSIRKFSPRIVMTNHFGDKLVLEVADSEPNGQLVIGMVDGEEGSTNFYQLNDEEFETFVAFILDNSRAVDDAAEPDPINPILDALEKYLDALDRRLEEIEKTDKFEEEIEKPDKDEDND